MARRKAKTPQPLAQVRASVARMQTQGERMVARLRREAQGFVARSRTEAQKELRDLERRVAKALHAATTEQVARLERRVAKLEQRIAERQKPSRVGEQAA